MNKISLPRHVLKKNLIMVIGIFLCVYFSYHALQGSRSISRLMEVHQNTERLEGELSALQAEREDLEEKVIMLRPGTINRDLLEERVRHVLGYRHPDEIAVVGGAAARL